MVSEDATTDAGQPRIEAGPYRRPPEDLREMDIWALWDLREKMPKAPWATDDMYRAGWGDGVVDDSDSRMTERPETDYETARMYARLPPEELDKSHSFPRTDENDDLIDHPIPERVVETILLPHNPLPTRPPLMQVDLDDVINAETGETTAEVARLLDRLGGYAEISCSETGIHVYVRGWLPDGLGKFIVPLNDGGSIELYDHGRFCACTWQHINGTPYSVPERQDVIDELILEYEDEQHRNRRLKAEQRKGVERERRRDETPLGALNRVTAALTDRDSENGDTKQNPYYGLSIEQVADTGQFAAYRRDAPGDSLQGPHPKHGPIHSDPEECSNFVVDDDKGWFCFADNDGGGTLELIAVLEDLLPCGSASTLHTRPRKLLAACLLARDEYSDGGLDGETPPYDVLVAVAQEHDLPMRDPDEGVLGRFGHSAARMVYDRLGAADIDTD